MKRVIIITYDLMSPGQNYTRLTNRIRTYSEWAKVGYSCYLVYTTWTPNQVRDDLLNYIDSNDKLYVGLSPAPSAWYGLDSVVSQWILDRQV